MKSITQTGGNFTYTYDDNGNIVSVVQDGKKTAYAYDTLGQLAQVDDQQENATWVYEYDQGGNILSKKKYAYGVITGEPVESKTFTYGNSNWKDQLTAVNGTPITYDAIGNPLNDGTWTYTWQNGRQLASMSKSGTTASFKYNENGLRVQKTVNGVTTDYTLHGNNVVHLKQGGDNLHFFYDAQSRPAVVVYNGTAYSYAKSLQGDIVAILNNTGTAVVRYMYDAWGRPISCTGTMATTLGKLNPFRYRSYVYDEEIVLYYLKNRYFMCELSRFLNADILYTEAGSLYQYCKNNPVRNVDLNGYRCFSTVSDLWCTGLLNEDESRSLSLYDSNRFDDSVFHEQILAVEFDPFDYDFRDLDATLIDTKIDLITGGWETENVDISLLDFGHAEASLTFSEEEGKLSVGAMASVWSPSISFTIFGCKITLGLEVLAVGVQNEVDLNKKSVAISRGYGLWGWSIGIEW